MKKALITGITGQDGSYLSELLLNKGYEVHGIIRRASTFNTSRIEHIYTDPIEHKTNFHLHYGDLSDSGVLTELTYNIAPDEIYHLGAQSHVRVSFDLPEYTGDITGLGTTRLLDSIRRSGIKTRFYQASSSELYGSAPAPQNELTPFEPQSPYAVAKLYSYWICKNYREAYGLFISNGILFNHESPRRGETFVTRKITRAVANIIAGRQGRLFLGNLDAKRDWGFAPEYVEMMWLMLQQDSPDDFAVGTGESHTVRRFAELAFEYAGIKIGWEGEGINEKGVIREVKEKYAGSIEPGAVVVEINPRYFRPTEVNHLQADISKAMEKLNWKPKVNFEELVKIMVDHDLESLGIAPPNEGIAALKARGFGWTEHKTVSYDIKHKDE